MYLRATKGVLSKNMQRQLVYISDAQLYNLPIARDFRLIFNMTSFRTNLLFYKGLTT